MYWKIATVIVLVIIVLFLIASEAATGGKSDVKKPEEPEKQSGEKPTIIIINADERPRPYYQYDPVYISGNPFWSHYNYRPHRSFGHRRIW
jgi:hypothetical protein